MVSAACKPRIAKAQAGGRKGPWNDLPGGALVPHHFVPPEQIKAGRFWLSPDEARHVAVVLRHKPGDEIGLFDGEDRAFRGVLESVSPERVEGRVVAQAPAEPKPYRLRLAQALPKGDTLEWILEKGTELGVDAFAPLTTERVVGRVPADRLEARLERWKKIMTAAARQCGRAGLPAVAAPVGLDRALEAVAPGDLVLVPWESEAGKTLKDALKEWREKGSTEGRTIHVIIGPEGGLAPQEVERAKARGAVPVTLGQRILRTETAGMAVAAAILYEYS